jgi:hypothetical protein
MKLLARIAVVSVCFAALVFLCAEMGRTSESAMDSAGAAYQAGNFAQAAKLYSGMLRSDPGSYSANLRLGNLALLANHLSEAESHLQKALTAQPDAAEAKTLLAEAYYRQDNFARAAEYLKTPGNGPDPGRPHFSSLNYEKLATFKNTTPYEISGPDEITRLKMIKVEPLPLVHVRVNGGKDVILFVDTGGAELGLDTEFAKELGLTVFQGTNEGTFAGGQHAPDMHSRIDSLTLGDWTVKNVPVQLLALRQLSPMFGVPRIDGVIGTIVLYHFLSTIDYPAGELVLRRRNPENEKSFRASLKSSSIAVPFWMAADHFIVGWGKVNELPPSLFFLDSGLAGAAVNLPESVLKKANIALDKSKGVQGEGAAGTFQSIPYIVQNVSFGEVHEQKVNGLYDGPVFWENGLGFYVGGMVGHEFLRSHAVTFDFDAMQVIFN